jgi:two-component system phosphate regulon sensor histidine kinase PhoR
MNRVLFFVVLFPALAVFALAGILVFYALSSFHRPALLWYGSVALALTSLICALFFGLRLRRRLRALYEFIAVAPQSDPPPSLPVWDEDEVGALERGLQHLVSRQYKRLRVLQGERKKLEAVLQSMAEGVVVIDPVGNVVLCNHASQELFALNPAGDWQGKPLQAFSRHPLLHELLREVAGKRSSDPPVTREIEIEGGKQRHLAVSAVQVSEDGSTVSGYVLVFHDLTQIKKLETIRADFVANVSHELRTPLTAIKGYAETLLGGAWQDPETARKFLSTIDRHAERLSRLINDLLTLSDLELGKAPLREEEVFLQEVVEEVFEALRDKADKGGVALHKDLPEGLPALWGDEDRVQQVLVNLVDNAVKYTPAGGSVTVRARSVLSQAYPEPKRRVEGTVPNAESGGMGQAGFWLPGKSSKLAGEWLEVAVSDTGCGIAEKEIPRLTQRFYRVDKARSRELGGTGLGLAIVKHIVQTYGGLLRIESRVNQGTTVHVFLPLSP